MTSAFDTLLGAEELLTTDERRLVDVAKAAPSQSDSDVDETTRLEATHWPRILSNPLKGSKSITLDACTASGRLLRWTVAKQRDEGVRWTDARSTYWGDLWPHEATSALQIRSRGLRKLKPDTRRSKEAVDVEAESDDPLDLTAILQSSTSPDRASF